MEVLVYIDYSPVRIARKVKEGSKEVYALSGEVRTIDDSQLPERSTRNYWKWDEEEKKIVVDQSKIEAVEEKQELERDILSGIKKKLNLTDEEWELLKKLVKR